MITAGFVVIPAVATSRIGYSYLFCWVALFGEEIIIFKTLRHLPASANVRVPWQP